MMRSSAILSVAVATLLHSIQAQAACYQVDGTDAKDDSWKPCVPADPNSGCCASNKGSRSDICLSSGLCYAQDGNYKGMIFQNGCTDQSGLSTSCPHFCPDATTNWDGGSKVASWNLLQCNQGVFCCRPATDSRNCCSNDSAVITADIGMLLVAATVYSTATTGAATVTVTPTGSAASSQDTCAGGAVSSSQEECPKDNTAVVGGAVGGVLGAALLASLGALAFANKRRRDQTETATAPEGWSSVSMYKDSQGPSQGPSQVGTPMNPQGPSQGPSQGGTPMNPQNYAEVGAAMNPHQAQPVQPQYIPAHELDTSRAPTYEMHS